MQGSKGAPVLTARCNRRPSHPASCWLQASLVVQTVRHLPTMRETQVQSLDWEDPLEKEMATHFSILPGKSHGRRSLVGYSPWVRRVAPQLSDFTFFHFSHPTRLILRISPKETTTQRAPLKL